MSLLLMGAGPGVNPASGGAGTIWNGSTDTPASSADWVRSGSNLIGTRSSGTGDALLRANNAKASGSFIVTVNNIGTSDMLIGLGTASMATSSWAGNTGGAAYGSGNNSFINGGGGGVGRASWTTGDQIKVSWDGTSVTYYKWNGSTFVQQGTPDNLSVLGTSSLYPIVSTGGTGAQVTADFTGW